MHSKEKHNWKVFYTFYLYDQAQIARFRVGSGNNLHLKKTSFLHQVHFYIYILAILSLLFHWSTSVVPISFLFFFHHWRFFSPDAHKMLQTPSFASFFILIKKNVYTIHWYYLIRCYVLFFLTMKKRNNRSNVGEKMHWESMQCTVFNNSICYEQLKYIIFEREDVK